MADPLKILTLLGSVREGRMAAPIGNWVLERGADRNDMQLELVDPKILQLPFFAQPKPPAAGNYQDLQQVRWAEKVASADGYVLICPEYNHSPSAVLKNMLDTVYAEWARKPVAFVGYGSLGAARSIEQMRLTTIALEMVPLNASVHLVRPGAKRDGDRFNADSYDDRALNGLFDSLSWWGGALKTARDAG